MFTQFTGLTLEQQAAYRDRGYHFPVRALAADEAAGLCGSFLDYYEHHRERMEKLLPRDRRNFLCETHFFLRWVYEMVSHSRVLDAVESVLGPNILVWSTQWFPKFPGDKAFVSWHQDATYWGLHPLNVTTAWIALSESAPQNGCMRVVPGTHKTPQLPQRETYGADNMLSRGQEIAVDVDEAQAVDLALRPGEFSLHHVAIVHGSGPNISDVPRSGLPCATCLQMLPTTAPSATWSSSCEARMNGETSRLRTLRNATWHSVNPSFTPKR
jgi:ectoine hydroxylase-related dioxygenase (phytanoyl-CoA dioxygenase family)